METRLEKRKIQRKNKRKKSIKKLFIVILLSILILGLKVVNESIVKITLEDSHLLYYERDTNTLDILGKSFILDFSFIKKLEQKLPSKR